MINQESRKTQRDSETNTWKTKYNNVSEKMQELRQLAMNIDD